MIVRIFPLTVLKGYSRRFLTPLGMTVGLVSMSKMQSIFALNPIQCSFREKRGILKGVFSNSGKQANYHYL
jgi:hypothetical protein